MDYFHKHKPPITHRFEVRKYLYQNIVKIEDFGLGTLHKVVKSTKWMWDNLNK